MRDSDQTPYHACAWGARLESDPERARANTCAAEWRAIEVLRDRAVSLGAAGVALTGSAARGRQTEVSDLDLHVIGTRPPFADLDLAIDVYAVSPDVHWSRLRAGGDFGQWTLRFGLILHDAGIFRESADFLFRSQLWPDVGRKRDQAERVLGMAGRIIATGDLEAAQEQVRSALTATARVLLLEVGVFPLCRDELSEQVRDIHIDLSAALQRSIHRDLDFDELAAGCRIADRLLTSHSVRR